MTTRWRMPPENSCGYWWRRREASLMPTDSSIAVARARAVRREIFSWMSSGSMSCSEMRR